ncbi:Zn-dependent hydrolase [Selenomonas sp. TAMA-11512]|uniref:Zn-dependent hydrolase n=1 Tax=Selenomonas sp. TAMA-11512 TaxID=3095337 RepID=UPI003092DC35|nr:Zn-dependent hydrolase [Selenomonas sp. TAMA-11512]
MINQERLAQDFNVMRGITAPGEGINRLAFTDSDWEGRAYLMRQMEAAGLTLRTDAFGNVLGRLAGKDNSLPAVMCGSHSDSVPRGGNYDGLAGVLAALETVRSMREDGFQPDHPIEVVLFMCEESSRFSAATLGSRAMRGELSSEDLQHLHDKEGKTLFSVLKERGLDPENIAGAKYTQPLKAMLELHIEQGKVLEHEGIPVGIVTGIAAPARFYCDIHGAADHSGATPMPLRHDALCAAAEIILAVERAAGAQADPPVVGTVGVVDVTPGVMNVIPGDVSLGVDLRSIDANAREQVEQTVRSEIEAITRARGLRYEIRPVSKESPARMAPALVDLIAAEAEKAGIPYRRMPSGAGHDSMHWADYAPTGMIFIPCRDGISHNPAEYASIEQIVTGVQLYSAVMRRLAVRGEDIS